MDYAHLSDNPARQVIDATTVFTELLRAKKQARIGPRSPDTENVFAEFTARKRALESRLKSLRTALTDAEWMNKALKSGWVPSTVVAVLAALEDAGLGQLLTVVGTHALYAYEAAAGIRIVQGALAT